MLKVWMIVMACMAPDFTTCQRMAAVEWSDPITCQLDRILVSGLWRIKLENQGHSNWSIFTRCEIVNPEKNGRRG